MPYGYGYGYYFDPTYLLVLIGVVISLWASAKVKTTYSKYSRVRSMSGLTGAQVADQILRANGIYDVRIEHVSGELTDHYDPKNRVLRLSDVVYNSTSVAALGVAAHECGHAVQDDKDYFPLRFRNALVPVANFGTQAAWPDYHHRTGFRKQQLFNQSGNPAVLPGRIVPAGDPAGGVRRVPPCDPDSGKYGNPVRR